MWTDGGINNPRIQPAVKRMRMRMRMRVCEEFWDGAVIRSETVSRLRRTHRCFKSVNLIILPGLFLHLLSFPLVFPVLLLEGMKCALIFLRSIMSCTERSAALIHPPVNSHVSEERGHVWMQWEASLLETTGRNQQKAKKIMEKTEMRRRNEVDEGLFIIFL